MLHLKVTFWHLLTVAVIVWGSSDPNDRPVSLHDDTPEIIGEPLSPLEFSYAEKLILHELVPDNSSIDPIEIAGLLDGDIRVEDDDDSSEESLLRNAVTDPKLKWPNGTVPYIISADFNENDRVKIARAMMEFEKRTCIKFKPLGAKEYDYIRLTKNDKGCSSNVGRCGGEQIVNLGEGCVLPGIIMHELNHVIGFWHEHNRYDRDDYVTIHFENIQRGAEENFRKVPISEANPHGTAYDTSSIMHYGPYAFTKSRSKNKHTITSRVPNENMGQRVDFTDNDIYKINQLYRCNGNAKNNTNNSNSNSMGTTTQKPADSSDCSDNHKNCQRWANNGECQKNPNWMLVNCKASCHQCRNDESCTNNNQHCEYWAANGECEKNPSWMLVNCKASCHQCRNDE